MITLYTFGPMFGLPDPSPFVMKAEFLLKLSGLAYRTDTSGFSRAPKGKLPYIDDDGVIVADSTLIRLHIEGRHGIDFDRGLTPAEKAVSWLIEKFFEDNLYWALLRVRWMDNVNFAKGPRNLFNDVPAILRPFAILYIRGRMRWALHAQGTGRYGEAELVSMVRRGMASVSEVLGDKPFLMGDRPCAADASAHAFITGLLCRTFDTPLRDVAESHANLVAYSKRLTAAYFPDFAEA